MSRSGSKTLSRSVSKDEGIRSMILEEMEEDEAAEPTNPYRILYIEAGQKVRSELTQEAIGNALAARQKHLEQCVHRRILESRLERAAEFLTDWERKDDYDTKLLERKEEKTWAILRFSNGIYEGLIKEGSLERKKPIKQGKGITSTINGERYEGVYEGNKRHGFGWQFWENGDFYRGQWKRDQMQGIGQYFYFNGDVYTGLFAENVAHHNKGCLEWANGDVYVGDFSEGRRTGNGTLKLFDGGVYTGQWVNGKEHGTGEFRCANGNLYQGQYEEGLFHGQGTQIFRDGEQCTGTFVNGRLDGDGTYAWADGDKYEGQFRLGQRCGQGTFEGHMAVYTGEWEDGSPEGEGNLKRVMISGGSSARRGSRDRGSKKRSSSKKLNIDDAPTSEYVGQWEGGLKEGRGSVVWPSGNSYEGEFRGDRKHGQGVFTWSSGNSWTGNFWLDKQHGLGNYSVKSAGGSKLKGTTRQSLGEATKSNVGDHEDLYHHGLLCERDGLPVKAMTQEDPKDGPRGSIAAVHNLEEIVRAASKSSKKESKEPSKKESKERKRSSKIEE